MKEALDAEYAGNKARWYEIFTGPRIGYRTIIGMVLRAFQRLTGCYRSQQQLRNRDYPAYGECLYIPWFVIC